MKRGHYKADAIVLNAFDYAESDAILVLYTREFGKLKGIAKHGRKSKRRFVGALDPVTLKTVDFFVNGRSEFVRLESAVVRDTFSSLKSDMERYSLASYMVELVDVFTREGLHLPELFDLLKGSLAALAITKSTETVIRAFELRLLRKLGLMPHLSSCVACSGRLLDGSAFFSPPMGGLVCNSCSSAVRGLSKIRLGTARYLEAVSSFEPDKLKRLGASPDILGEADRTIYSFILYQAGRDFKTRRFIDSMRSSLL